MTYKFTDFMDLKADKAGVRNLRKWLNGENMSDVLVAKYLSSTLTHIMIEAEFAENEDDAVDRAIGYKADLIAGLIQKLISGETPTTVIRRILLKVLEDERNEERI